MYGVVKSYFDYGFNQARMASIKPLRVQVQKYKVSTQNHNYDSLDRVYMGT